MVLTHGNDGGRDVGAIGVADGDGCEGDEYQRPRVPGTKHQREVGFMVVLLLVAMSILGCERLRLERCRVAAHEEE